MRLLHNSLAHQANNHLAATNARLAKSLEKLSSGYKINKSSDDPTGQSISQRMRAQIRGLNRATNNAADGISLIQTAEGALNEIHSVLARIQELAVKAANEVYNEEDRDSMQAEIVQLTAEIDRISDTTDFNGRNLLNGELNKKAYTNNFNLRVVEIGGDVEPGDYELNVAAIAERAIVPNLNGTPGTVFTESGTISINGFSIEIKAGQTIESALEVMHNSFSKIGIEIVTEPPANNISDYTLRSMDYGFDQEIQITASNAEIAGALGINPPPYSAMNPPTGDRGADATASVVLSPTSQFRDSAAVSVDGNRITITDSKGFKMVYNIPDTVPAGTIFAPTVTVLSAGPMVLQIGNDEGQTLNVNIAKTDIVSLEIDDINIYTHEYASQTITKIDKAVKRVSEIRSSLGAYQNRLDYTTTNLATSEENLTTALTRIKDTNMAEEMTEYTQQNLLNQSAMQMIIRANALPEGLLQLLQK